MNTSIDLECLVLTPAALPHPGLAVAAARAGAVGILNLEFCQSSDLKQAEANLSQLLSLLNDKHKIGLRIHVAQLEFSKPLLARLAERPHYIILCGGVQEEIETAVVKLQSSQCCRLIVEITQSNLVQALKQSGMQIDGIVACGHECGGWTSAKSVYVLAQELLNAKAFPVYIRGGIGLHTASACRIAGSAGVVLDDQLLLMPESPLPLDWLRHLETLNGQEALVLGERLGFPCRVLIHPEFRQIKSLQNLARELELADDSLDEIKLRWQQGAASYIRWGSPENSVWPVGQSVGLAARLRDRYRTTGNFIQALKSESHDRIRGVGHLSPLAPNAPLARSHGTQYPIVQGPMTRVSNKAKFAEAVAKAGALPFLALALMSGEQVRTLLEETREKLGNRSWGVGILGFVPPNLRKEQVNEILRVKPPYALIAGGRPNQAAELEAQGVQTYLHTPVPSLLTIFLKQGARRFIFEGRECGGHVGPLGSFVLWEQMIETLLQEVPLGEEEKIHVLFAGGVHNALSAAMVATMAAPLTQRGMRVGVLMGTSYLFTEEAVVSGAIVQGFQKQALECTQTINLESGLGHANRCAMTPFATEFYTVRKRLLKESKSADEIKEELDKLVLGRLRLASQGVMRDDKGNLLTVEEETQLREGMYMLGDVATLRSNVCTIEELHKEVSQESTNLISTFSSTSEPIVNDSVYEEKPSDIAIIGIATLLPQAQNPEIFWTNILRKVNAITEVPPDRWDWRLYYDQDPKAPDKSYSKWGGFFDEVIFDPLRFGIPPKSLKYISVSQLLALEIVRWALKDAGYESGNFDRENTSVILANSDGGGFLGHSYTVRTMLPLSIGSLPNQILDRLPEWSEESFPGTLTNVSAGRIANRFDLGGTNFTVDAACASSLIALDLAVRELESGRSNLAIAGGVDVGQDPHYYIAFSKTQALSPNGRARTFDKAADGIVLSEGVAVVILKRLADAERDGDRIYAVIKSVANSSDGKALGMTAPRPLGQMRALKRAYRKAGIPLNTVDFYEAHGTGTAVGDQAELETIVSMLKAHGAANKSCCISSAKSLIGHTKITAGLVGLVKSALSMYHKVLPPHAEVENPLDQIVDPESPVYLRQEAKPWFARQEHPRRSGVSCFGFGGTNSHAVLEEYTGEFQERAPGADNWPCELILLRGEDCTELISEVQRLHKALDSGAEPRLQDLAYSYASFFVKENKTKEFCACIVTENLGQLKTALELILDHLEGRTNTKLPPHIILSSVAKRRHGRIAFLFPGQGAQYPDMAREVALYFKEFRAGIEFANQYLKPHFSAKLLSDYIYPPGAYTENEKRRNEEFLMDTRIAQPAIGAISMCFYDLIVRLGLKPDMVCGHSYGEYIALHAAGALSREDFLNLSTSRGRAMAESCNVEQGAMAAVRATREHVESRLHKLDGVFIVNHNAPQETVISGHQQAVKHAVNLLTHEGIRAVILPTAGAFHSPLMVSAQKPLSEAIANVQLQPPQIPVYANQTAQPYGTDEVVIREQMENHLLSTVEFVGQINQMYKDGARVFVEIGPKNILTRMVEQILKDRDYLAVSLEGRGGGLRNFLLALGELLTNGININLKNLFEQRDVRLLDLERLVELTSKSIMPSTAWLVNGSIARPQTESVPSVGKLPILNSETANLEQQQILQDIPVIKQFEEPTSSRKKISLEKEYPIIKTEYKQPSREMEISTRNGRDVNKSENGVKHKDLNSSISISQSDVGFFNTSDLTHDAAVLTAYKAYQETMRQFLKTQEEVMQQFLGDRKLSQAASLNLANQESIHSEAKAEALKPVSSVTQAAPTQEFQQVLSEKQPLADLNKEETSSETAASLERTDLTLLLVKLVSDRTGYPPSMLGMDQDIEAELGIDSIKRVEILEEFLKALPQSLVTNLQDRIEDLTRQKSLNRWIDAVLAGVADFSLPKETSSETAAPLERTDLTLLLVKLVSDRTGYPPSMLGMDQDIEAELGIDSIKRVEILEEFLKALPQSLVTNLQDRIEDLTRQKSLNRWIDAVLAGVADSSSTIEQLSEDTSVAFQLKQDVTEEISKQAEPTVEENFCPRYVMQAKPEPLPNIPLDSPEGLFLITEDQISVAFHVSEALRQRNAHTVIISNSTCSSLEELNKNVAELRRVHGPIKGIIHLSPLTDITIPTTLSEWRKYTQNQSKSLFQILSQYASNFHQKDQPQKLRILAASMLGGYFGRDGQCGPGLPTGGSSQGLLKTLEIEWPFIQAKAIDFDNVLSPAKIAQHIVEELLLPAGQIEVSYPRGNRTVFSVVPAPLPLSKDRIGLQPADDWVVLITGGARGITSEIARVIAKAGMRIIVVGRSPEPSKESADTRHIEDISLLRKLMVERTYKNGATKTPAQIENELQELLRQRTIRQNLTALRQTGAKVTYLAADVKNEEEFKLLLEEIYSHYGRLDAVIHGAGIIEDKLVVDKSIISFDAVFDTKVDSTFLLYRHLRPESLKLVVLFSSTAGRFGNRGQSDYGAANEVLNRFALRMRQDWPSTRIVSINWGPWASTGMASETVNRRFRQLGIIPIPTEAGCRFFMNEIYFGDSDTEVIAGEGNWGSSI